MEHTLFTMIFGSFPCVVNVLHSAYSTVIFLKTYVCHRYEMESFWLVKKRFDELVFFSRKTEKFGEK